MAHKWPYWLHNALSMESLKHSKEGGKIRSCPHFGWIGFITPAVWGVPNATERETK